MAEVIDVASDLELRIPMPSADAPQPGGDARNARIQVVVEGVFITRICPVPTDAPFRAVWSRYLSPLVEAAHATRQSVHGHAPAAVVGKAAKGRALGVQDFGKIAVAVIAIADEHVAAPIEMVLAQVTAFDMAYTPRMLCGVA